MKVKIPLQVFTASEFLFLHSLSAQDSKDFRKSLQ